MSQCIREIRSLNPKMIIFLDRSARPLAWLFSDMWPKNVSKPGIRFINVGYPDLHDGTDNIVLSQRRIEFLASDETRAESLDSKFTPALYASPAFKTEPGVLYPMRTAGISSKGKIRAPELKGNELAERLADAFAADVAAHDKIVIFDEMSVGTSVTYVADQLLKAFPDSEPYALCFAKMGLSDRETIPPHGGRSGMTDGHSDMEYPLPWVRAGWSGVYEWPTEDALFSLALTKENVEKIRSGTVDAKRRLVRDALEAVLPAMLESVTEYIHYLNTPAAIERLGESTCKATQAKFRILERWAGALMRPDAQYGDQLGREIYFVNEYLQKFHPDFLDWFPKRSGLYAIAERIDNISWRTDDILQNKKDDYPHEEKMSTSVMRERSAELREEMKQVAKGL